MKSFSIFFLILIVLLSAFPCGDEVESHDFSLTTITAVDKCNGKGSAESCSPICLCTCCGQSLLETELAKFTIEIPILEIGKLSSSYKFMIEQRAQNIWQPPKIA